MTPLERITERVSRNGDINDPSTPHPLVTLEEFFEGNDVDGSIWCNCSPMPSPSEAYAVLKKIRSTPNVADVRVEVSMFDVPEWPFSETVWVITSASPEDVHSWFPESVAPDECWLGWREGCAYEPIEVPKGMHLIGCWWD
ncbi:MAG TPA: hypothetical protein VHS31_09430 [Tepidisphaeraceae bacterium]|jgi:hypothetical protein|nr:hypothetical protein [Tepidisphaeraceae bacterium]